MQLYARRFKAMGSPCELQIHALDARAAARIADLVVDDVARLEARYSRYRTDSELSRINAIAAAGGSTDVDAETASLLDYAAACHAESGGLFDVTSGLLRQAWRFDRERVPDDAALAPLLARIGWEKLSWVPPVIEFRCPGMELDFGGIVKEYAADRAAALCVEAGVRHGLVNLGGDVKLIGTRPDGTPWQVGIEHPRRPGTVLATLPLQGAGVATSGDYERCIVIDGVRYSHLLHPRTGRPVRHLAAVTVVADLCVVAGSASTIAMLKEESGPAWLTALGLPHLWVDHEGRCGGTLYRGES